MNAIAEFKKVSVEQFNKDWNNCFGKLKDNVMPYDEIKIPQRATIGSAGYDFYSPIDFALAPGEMIKFPTGIRARIDEGWVLMMFPRSGLGFNYKLQLNNTVGIIDSDYYNALNEGHIFIKLTNDGDKLLIVRAGDAIVQGVFVPFGIVTGDDASGIRTRGFGSTSK